MTGARKRRESHRDVRIQAEEVCRVVLPLQLDQPFAGPSRVRGSEQVRRWATKLVQAALQIKLRVPGSRERLLHEDEIRSVEGYSPSVLREMRSRSTG